MSGGGGGARFNEPGAAQAVAPDLALVKHEMDAEEYDMPQHGQEQAPLPDLSVVKVEIDIEEYDLLQHPRMHVALQKRGGGRGTTPLAEVAEQARQPWSSAVVKDEAGAQEPDPLLHATPPMPQDLLCAEEEPPAAQGVSSNSATSEGIIIKTEDNAMSDHSRKLFSSTVVLRDCAAELQQSGRYCQQCRVLFPSWSALAQHNSAASALLAGTLNRAKKFKCAQCEYRTDYSNNLRQHERTHTGEKPLKCNQCDYRTAYSRDLKRHLRTGTGNTTYTCYQCDYTTAYSCALRQHMRTHSGDQPFQCNYCEFKTTQNIYLRHHIRTHTGEKLFKCDQCEYRATKSSHLKQHMRIHTGERPFQCDQCHYRAAHICNLKKHMTTHMLKNTSNKDSVGCGAEAEGLAASCQPSVSGRSDEMDAEGHDMAQHGQEQAPLPDLPLVKVEICIEPTEVAEQEWQPWDNAFVEAGAQEPDPLLHAEPPMPRDLSYPEEELPVQVASSHTEVYGGATTKDEETAVLNQSWNLVSSKEKKYKCDRCEYRTAYSSDLKRHMSTHTGEKLLKCDHCEYRTAYGNNLRQHVRTHTGEKHLKCNLCEYRTAYSNDLKRHLRTHTGEKPYTCDQCDYKTAYSCDLRQHMRSHTGDKPFKCDQCEYRTTQSIYLKRHIRTHTGEKPFKCDKCEYRAAQSSHLKQHIMRMHLGIKPIKCDRCEYRAAYSCDLRKHMVTHKNKDSIDRELEVESVSGRSGAPEDAASS